MNRRHFLALPLLLALLSLAASVWEGSAIVGGADDFPDEGLFGACNSFPRDASVEVRNLENGKTVSVVITKNVDNPGVFIALSPKAAAVLGMRQGSAARVRATTLSLSMPESTLPAARAGQTADPDFNPKVFVDREKAALAAAAPAATAPAATAAPSTSAAIPEAAAPIAAAEAPATAAAPASAGTIAAAPVEEAAATLIAAATNVPPQPEPPAAPTEGSAEKPAIEEPLTPEEALILALEDEGEPAVDSVKLPPDETLAAEAASSETGKPLPELLAVDLPAPDLLALKPASEPPSARNFPTNLPEAIGGAIPKPRPASAVKAYLPEPSFAARIAASREAPPETPAAPIVPSLPETASVDALERPKLEGARDGVALAEPLPTFSPDELPEELLPRLAGPAPVLPEFALAEIGPPSIAETGPSQGPEAIALSKPGSARVSGAEGGASILAAPEAPYPDESLADDSPELSGALAYDDALDEPEAALRAAESPALDQGPTALVAETPSTALLADADLRDPETPSPAESLAAERPASGEALLAETSLEEPDLPYIEKPEPAIALGLERPGSGKGLEAETALGEPGLPAPEESIVIAEADRLAAAQDGDLGEPGVPSPSESLAMGETQTILVADHEGEHGEPGVPRPDESLAMAGTEPLLAAEHAGALGEPGLPESGESLALAGTEPLLAAERVGELGEPGLPAPDADLAGERLAPALAAGGDIVVSLEPTSPRPPEPGKDAAAAGAAAAPIAAAPIAAAPKSPAPGAAAAAPAVPVPDNVPLIAALASGSYYVQIGVYGNGDSLRGAVSGFQSTYPLAMEKVRAPSGPEAYRLYVGPLSRDESGLVLYRIKSMGFRDAFVKQGS